MYTTGTNGRDIPIFMKLCYEFWAYCVNGTNQMLTVTAASNANPITITTLTPHGLSNSQLVGVYGVQGNTAANGGFNVTVVNSTQFSLNGAVGNGAYTSGGTVVVPGGIPIGPTSGPAGFFEGSSVVAVGNDGVTSAIGNTLTAAGSQPFNSTMVGKHVVIWIAGASTGVSQASATQSLPQSTINVASTAGFPSTGTIYVVTSTGIQTVTYGGTNGTQFLSCTGGTGIMAANAGVSVNPPSADDSIYRIVSVNSNTQIQIVPFSGGVPDISTLKNNITSRASLSYRVIDVIAASQLSVASGNYFIGQFNGAPNINTGQATSQFQFLLRGVANAFGQFGMVASPNGSWNGSVFSGTGSNTTMTERTSVTGLSVNGATSNTNGFVTMFADTDFFFAQICNTTNSNGGANAKGAYFMATTPQRLYSQAQDPNLIAVLVGFNGLNMSNGSDSFCTSFGMVGFDGVTRSHQLITRNFVGDMANATVGPTYTVGFDLSTTLGYQARSAQVIMGEGLMASTATAGQFSFARARIRPMRFTFSGMPQYNTVGNSGEFVHLANGLLMPWDGTILPYPVLPSGT